MFKLLLEKLKESVLSVLPVFAIVIVLLVLGIFTGTFTLSDPENPEPVSININSIKSLEAADPNSGIPSLGGFEPNSQGSAGFNLKFDLPGGRDIRVCEKTHQLPGKHKRQA